MARTVGIGRQNFEAVIKNNCFYVDKTMFLKEWWENEDEVTLITRPRRFGKTLNLSMTERFFSNKYKGQGDVFENLAIWKEEKYRYMQGTFPVISFSFASVKEVDFRNAREKICQLIASEYARHAYLLERDCLTKVQKETFERKSIAMGDVDATLGLSQLSEYLFCYYGKKAIILLDEYDTPLQEAYVHGYWNEMVSFIRSLFNATFKTNPYLDRALMTGITRVSKESIFSDLNNLEIVTSTSKKYQDVFGFTQQEVTGALDEFGLLEKEKDVKDWYDGFTFGEKTDIYNPWSILNYLDKKIFAAYWANTSSNSLVGKLIREGGRNIKYIIEDLIRGKSLHTVIDEQIVYNQLDDNEGAVWSLLLASGYLKVVNYEATTTEFGRWVENYELTLTNFEVKVMFENMIQGWFKAVDGDYNDFIKALLRGDVEEMNAYMSRVCEDIFSFFDTGRKYSDRAEPERFYHGFVLGLMMDLNERYLVTSNRESGFGRYDVQLEPRRSGDDGILIEFKVRNPKREQSLEETVQNALEQIEKKDYAAALRRRGVPEEQIRTYGFAFEGKTVLIDGGYINISDKQK